MKSFFQKTGAWIMAHKVVSIIIIIILIGGGYYAYAKTTSSNAPTRYVLGTVQKGTIVASVSGTGQVAAVTQLDVKPKVSGQLLSINVVLGQKVTTGTVLGTIDDTDAEQAVRDAKVSLASAQLNLTKTTISSQNDLVTDQQAKDEADSDLSKSYEDAMTDVTSSFSDLPSINLGLGSILDDAGHSSYFQSSQIQETAGQTGLDLRNTALAAYAKATASYQTTLAEVTAAGQSSDPDTVNQLVSDTYTTLQAFSDAVKDTTIAIDFLQNDLKPTQPAQMTTDLSSLDSYTSEVSGHLSSVLGDQTSIQTAADADTEAASTLQKASALQTTADESSSFDDQSAQISVEQAQNSLEDAEENLADYTVTAPFDGVVAALPTDVGDTASSASVIATLTTPAEVADVSLNEVDAAKVQVGDKATLTFDALPDLTTTGTVIELDAIGTVTQGVVTYDAKISIDTPTDDVKPGMTVSASIISAAKTDVLVVPSGAIKTTGTTGTVQVVPSATAALVSQSQGNGIVLPTTPQTVSVQTGISSDTDVEIVSGLTAGETIVTRTVAGGTPVVAATPAATTRTGAGAGGALFGGGGGAAGGAAGTARRIGL